MRCLLLLTWVALSAGQQPLLADDAVESEAAAAKTAAEQAEFFERDIRPLLVERCQKCHGGKKQWANLRLDSRAAILKGGDSGAAADLKQPAESELLKRVTADDEDVRMPPAEAGDPLKPKEIAALTRWIELGMPWPESKTASGGNVQRAWDAHWAFQPVKRADPPAVKNEAEVQTPIDRFIIRKLEQNGLSLSPPADRRTLIRRASYDLTGLPPTPAEVESFINDQAADAYARLIDRLLQSPRYGEQWGRHWLDVARYSDSKGYVYAREERFYVHAANYRDWVIESFNGDLAYDRFLKLQLAADQFVPESSRDLAAMGFLTLGRRFLGVTPDIMDDRIDVVTRGMLGLTVACARCHDHKYDPIPTADYYSLYGVFHNSVDHLVPIPRGENAPAPDEAYQQELAARKQKLAETMAASRAAAGKLIRERIGDYLFAQRELEKYPVQGFDQILAKSDLIPATVRRWQRYLASAAEDRRPVFVPWSKYAELSDKEFAGRAAEVTGQLQALPPGTVNPLIARAFAAPPASPRDVADRYAKLFMEIDRQWQERLQAAAQKNDPAPAALDDAAAEELRQVLYGGNSPAVIPDEPIVDNESFFDSDTCNALWKLQVEVDRHLIPNPAAAPHAVILVDRPFPIEQRILVRGNAANPGEEVERHFLSVIAGKDRPPFEHGSGRRELAEAIANPANPLTARVWVNRVWMQHFGQGLVSTPSDFGMRADAPSHPELLDWLAGWFVENNWSTKALHRLIMSSAVYMQRSDGEAAAGVASRSGGFQPPNGGWKPPLRAEAGTSQRLQPRPPGDSRQRSMAIDPANRLLWRMNARRLSFEELRDTLLAVSDSLDPQMRGKPADLFAGGPRQRRTVYTMVDRQFLPTVLRTFDFANPDLHSPERSQTTVPQQALFALNHPFVAGRATAVAGNVQSDETSATSARITRLYQQILQRDPTPDQLSAALAFIEGATNDRPEDPRSRSALAWSYGYGELDEAAGKLKSFQPLPFFNGSAWQGGPQYPDAALGWVQLTAQGGHPGNDLQHAAIRRWTAPRDGTVRVTSKAIHEVEAGDGIRCWIVSSRGGVLLSVALHNETKEMNVDEIALQAGDTLDFIADIKQVLNSDQHLWAPRIEWIKRPAASAETPATAWNAETDFGGPIQASLGPWAQLAQVLLVSNELMFVD